MEKPCPDCQCPAGHCERLEFERALEQVRIAHAEATGTDLYDTKGDYAHTEHRV